MFRKLKRMDKFYRFFYSKCISWYAPNEIFFFLLFLKCCGYKQKFYTLFFLMQFQGYSDAINQVINLLWPDLWLCFTSLFKNLNISNGAGFCLNSDIVHFSLRFLLFCTLLVPLQFDWSCISWLLTLTRKRICITVFENDNIYKLKC